MQAQTKCFSRLSKIDWISFFAVNAISSNPCAGPFIFLSLSTCTEEFASTPKIITFLPNSLPTEKVPYLSNPKLYPEYLLLSILAFFTNLLQQKKNFLMWIIIISTISQIYSMNNLYICCFSMSKCSFILF